MADNFITDILNSINSIITGIESFFTTARNFLLTAELGVYNLVFIILFIIFVAIFTAVISSPLYITKIIADNKNTFDKVKKIISYITGK